MDVMHAREFPLCALYLTVPTNAVDVNVSPAKTEVHFLEPNHVRAFIIKTLRDRLSKTMVQNVATAPASPIGPDVQVAPQAVVTKFDFGIRREMFQVRDDIKLPPVMRPVENNLAQMPVADEVAVPDLPLGRVVGQIGNKYIIAQKDDNMVIVDQHAAHERITYEKLRAHKIKTQPLLTPIVVNMRDADVMAVMSIADELKAAGLVVGEFGEDAIAIFEKPADWDLNWGDVLRSVADEVRANGHSSQLSEKLHLKLANYACHHSVRAGQKLDLVQMDALLRDIEKTERAGQCNHGRPVYKFIAMTEIDTWFERL